MNMFPRRILFIVNTMNVGGAETFIMKLFRNIDREEVVFDFLINELNNDFYISEIESLGGRVYPGYSKSKNVLKSLLVIFKIVRNNHYKTVFRLAEHPLCFMDLLSAKFAGAKKLIARSTNTRNGGKISNIAAVITRPLIAKVATVKLAPSSEAAEWLFGYKTVQSNKVYILKNAVDLSAFKYNFDGRIAVRKEFCLEDKFIVGHIGRFDQQKNHMFLIQIFSELLKYNKNAVLLLVGQGELEKDIRRQVNGLEIQNNVIFAGIRSDIPEVLSAIDVLVFPSLYEGMPNVVIEAQATGLPCVISDSITKEVKLTDLVNFCSLSDSVSNWAETVMNLDKKDRSIYGKQLKKEGYSLKDTVKEIQQILLK